MQEWWDSLSLFQQIMFVIAVPSTIIMFIFLILMLVGIDGSDAFDAGDIGDIGSGIDSVNDEPLTSLGGLKIFTLRGVLAFLSVGGWVAYSLSSSISNLLSGLIGIVAGAVAAILMALAFKAAMRLESEGNLDYRNSIGKIGTVYIRIPKNRSGSGKINIMLQEQYLEVSAVTDENQDLLKGVSVEVVDLQDDSTVIVRKK